MLALMRRRHPFSRLLELSLPYVLQARAAGKPPMEGENLIKPLISSAFEKVRVITSRMCPLICVWWAEKCLRGILMRPPLCPPLQIHSILLETDYYKIDPALHRLHDRLVHVIQGKPLIHGGPSISFTYGRS